MSVGDAVGAGAALMTLADPGRGNAIDQQLATDLLAAVRGVPGQAGPAVPLDRGLAGVAG